MLVFAFFGYILITGDSTNVKFIVFGGRIVLAFTVLIIQLISMYAIRRMIRKNRIKNSKVNRIISRMNNSRSNKNKVFQQRMLRDC